MDPASGGVVFLHWFDPEAPDGNRSQFVDEAVGLAASLGVVSILPQGRFPWHSDPKDGASDTYRILVETDDNLKALDLLHDRVNGNPVAMVGHDFGAMHGVLLAAQDRRVAASVLIALTPRWGDWFLPFWEVSGDRFDYLRDLHPFDPVNRIGDLAPRPVLFQFAEDDFYIAPMSGRELYHAAGEPREFRSYEADHGMRHPQAAADRSRFLADVLGWPIP